MKSSLVTKLESLCDRHEEVSALLSDAETASDPNKFRSLSQEYSQLDEVVKVYESYRRAQDDLVEAQGMLQDADVELREMAEEEIAVAEQHMVASEAELQVLMLPKDPKDSSNVFLRFEPVRGATRRLFFQVTCSECTHVTRRANGGPLKSSQSGRAIMAVIKN